MITYLQENRALGIRWLLDHGFEQEPLHMFEPMLDERYVDRYRGLIRIDDSPEITVIVAVERGRCCFRIESVSVKGNLLDWPYYWRSYPSDCMLDVESVVQNEQDAKDEAAAIKAVKSKIGQERELTPSEESLIEKSKLLNKVTRQAAHLGLKVISPLVKNGMFIQFPKADMVQGLYWTPHLYLKILGEECSIVSFTMEDGETSNEIEYESTDLKVILRGLLKDWEHVVFNDGEEHRALPKELEQYIKDISRAKR